MTPSSINLQPSNAQYGPPVKSKVAIGIATAFTALMFAGTSLVGFVFGWDYGISEALAGLYMFLISAYGAALVGRTYIAPRMAIWASAIGGSVTLLASVSWVVPIFYGLGPELVLNAASVGFYAAALGVASSLLRGGAP